MTECPVKGRLRESLSLLNPFRAKSTSLMSAFSYSIHGHLAQRQRHRIQNPNSISSSLIVATRILWKRWSETSEHTEAETRLEVGAVNLSVSRLRESSWRCSPTEEAAALKAVQSGFESQERYAGLIILKGLSMG